MPPSESFEQTRQSGAVTTLTISVYIPTHNRVDLLAVAVGSVLAQEFADFELIVVDDASTDGTAEFLESAAASDRRIRFIRNDSPCGAPTSRNRAIMEATGNFITGLDDDDTVRAATTERASRMLDLPLHDTKYQSHASIRRTPF